MITETTIVLQLVLAAALGSIIGIEREMREQPAGLRTHMLVCMGAALFVTLAAIALEAGEGDPSAYARIIAGVVTGVGFLGAGTIFREKTHVLGLSTAADIWVIAAIGSAVGMGQYIAAFAATLILFSIVGFVGFAKRKFIKRPADSYEA